MALRAAVVEGWRPAPGSGRLILLRFLLSIVAGLPAMAVASGVLGEAVGRRPYFTEAPDPLPIPQLMGVIARIGPAWGAVAGGAILAWLGGLLLTAGAIALFDPARPTGHVNVWRITFDTGTRFLWPYLRVALLALIAILAGGRAIVFVFERIADHGRAAGWTGAARVLVAIGRPLALLAWASLVGVCAWWCRVIVVADGRRQVRRLTSIVPRLGWRHPLQGVLFHWLAAMGSVLAGAGVLVAWRQSAAPTGAWLTAWLAVLLLQAVLWHWRLRSCRLLWAAPDAADLRSRPDEPWHLFRRLRARLRAIRRPGEADRRDGLEATGPAEAL